MAAGRHRAPTHQQGGPAANEERRYGSARLTISLLFRQAHQFLHVYRQELTGLLVEDEQTILRAGGDAAGADLLAEPIDLIDGVARPLQQLIVAEPAIANVGAPLLEEVSN